jgi:hypothetical protein
MSLDNLLDDEKSRYYFVLSMPFRLLVMDIVNVSTVLCRLVGSDPCPKLEL